MNDARREGAAEVASALLRGAVVFAIAGAVLTPLWGGWSGDSDTGAGFALAFLSIGFAALAAIVTTILSTADVVVSRRRSMGLSIIAAGVAAVVLQPLAGLARRGQIESCDYGPDNPAWCQAPDPKPPGRISLAYGIAGAIIAISVVLVGLLRTTGNRHRQASPRP